MALSLLAASLCASMGMMAFAAWSQSGEADNALTMAGYQTRIIEEYQVPEHVDPGAEIDKVVNVENTGTVDTLIRVSVEKAFGTRKKDGTFQKDGTLDPDMIQITYGTSAWSSRDDGYFYYKEILRAGETTKEPLFRSFTLSPRIGEAYEGKDAQIVVRMESVQAEGDGISLWGLEWKDLGITAPEGANADPVRVSYQGRDSGFDISAERTDLFASFKDLLPGCARTQRISIENASDEAVEILLRAEAASQEKMSARQSELVKELLEEHAAIEITQGKETLYEGPVSGNLDGKEHTMKNDISLGTFIPHDIEELKVKLSLDPAMDNESQELCGKVKWIFTAKGEDGEAIHTVRPEKTGIERLFGWCGAVSLLSLSAGVDILSWPYRKRARL